MKNTCGNISHRKMYFLFILILLIGNGIARSQGIVQFMDEYQVTVNVTLTTGQEPVNAEINLIGLDPPYLTYSGVTPSNGTLIFEEVEQGHYDITVYKAGYYGAFIGNSWINSDKVFDIILEEKKYAPTHLTVNPLSLDATWTKPLRVALEENFEGALFPPESWQSLTYGTGWFYTYDGSSTNWTISSWNSRYACSNDDLIFPNDGCCDYLITPPMDLRECDGYILSFDSFYDGALGEIATIEYSLDDGETWAVFLAINPNSTWTKIEADLSPFSGNGGPSAVLFAFHANDNGGNASGWAIDNVKIYVPDPPANFIDFWVFIDDAIVGTTIENKWNFAPLPYNEVHTASVAARYSSGLSDKIYYTFQSVYLTPPFNLAVASPSDSVILVWNPPLEFTASQWVAKEMRREEFPNPYNEYSPTVRAFSGHQDLRSKWELQLAFPTVVNNGETGAETDGNFLYSTMWNDTVFQKYNLDGIYVGPVTIQGVGGIRDMAYDPSTGHMHGSAVTNLVFEWDFTSGTMIGSLVAPTLVRAIAYDEQFDGFWANNWSSALTLFDKNGVQLNSFPVGAYGNFYGLAYDKWSNGGPYLWGYSQEGSGNLIVQIDIATGQQTGFVFDVSSVLPLGLGIAGGLFTHPDLIKGTVSIGGVSQNDTYFLFELSSYGGPPGVVPENLLGYNIYRDDNFLLYQPHSGSYPDPELQWSYDTDLLPGIYSYTIKGIYDLTPYGFPGETGETTIEGPAIAKVGYCNNLDFIESWESGNFGTNKWTTEEVNWFINGQTGNPAPAVEFKWDPLLFNYSSSLTSYPLCGSDLSEGRIWLDYHLKLTSTNNTGLENMLIQVWTWTNQDWVTIRSYNNQGGNFDWLSEHIDISAHALNSVFRVRFNAMGANSVNILGWFIDNVNIYRICDPPSNLESDVDLEQMTVILNWVPPVAQNPDGPTGLAGYNIYRSVNGGSYHLLDFVTMEAYIDEDLFEGMYCYKVTAVWSGAVDVCESAFSNERCELLVDIDEPDSDNSTFTIYPNPADDHAYITADRQLKRITVYDAMGRLMEDYRPTGVQFDLKTSSYATGIYTVRVETSTGTRISKLSILR